MNFSLSVSCFVLTNYYIYILQVVGKILSVALKYHFRMPPYFTLVLRSLASLEGWNTIFNSILAALLYTGSFSAFRLLFISSGGHTGLAMAADPQFKTFQAAYPFVVQKLLHDNSASTRAILNSVFAFSAT